MIKIPVEPLYNKNININEYMISCRNIMSIDEFREQLEIIYMEMNNDLIKKTENKIEKIIIEYENIVID